MSLCRSQNNKGLDDLEEDSIENQKTTDNKSAAYQSIKSSQFINLPLSQNQKRQLLKPKTPLNFGPQKYEEQAKTNYQNKANFLLEYEGNIEDITKRLVTER